MDLLSELLDGTLVRVKNESENTVLIKLSGYLLQCMLNVSPSGSLSNAVRALVLCSMWILFIPAFIRSRYAKFSKCKILS